MRKDQASLLYRVGWLNTRCPCFCTAPAEGGFRRSHAYIQRLRLLRVEAARSVIVQAYSGNHSVSGLTATARDPDIIHEAMPTQCELGIHNGSQTIAWANLIGSGELQDGMNEPSCMRAPTWKIADRDRGYSPSVSSMREQKGVTGDHFCRTDRTLPGLE
jgi:hypothetical protein